MEAQKFKSFLRINLGFEKFNQIKDKFNSMGLNHTSNMIDFIIDEPQKMTRRELVAFCKVINDRKITPYTLLKSFDCARSTLSDADVIEICDNENCKDLVVETL